MLTSGIGPETSALPMRCATYCATSAKPKAILSQRGLVVKWKENDHTSFDLIDIMKRFIGTKEFYKSVFAVALPIMLQNGISNFVGLLDNLMVGRLGTEQMAGVSIANNLMLVYQLCIFGAVSGAGIFTAQFFGQKNKNGIQQTFRIKLILSLVLTLAGIVVFMLWDKPLVSLYLHEGSDAGDLSLTLSCGHMYILTMLFGLIPQGIEMSYSSTLRETGETVVPMRASLVAVAVNLVLNYVLIYGKLGIPALGVVGAAIATVVARFVQAAIVVVWLHKNTEKMPYADKLFATLAVPRDLLSKVLVMGAPLILNEGLWALGVVLQSQSYSTRGLAVVAATNINSTIYNVFNIAFVAFGDATAILVGQHLGAGRMKEAKDTSSKIIAFTVCVCIFVGAVIFLTAGLYPMLYNTTDEVKSLAESFIRVTGIMLPLQGACHCLYFTIRAGGKTFITFLFDSAFSMAIVVPLAYVLTRLTGLDIVLIFALVELTSALKVAIGLGLLKSGVWMQNIVG